MNKCENCKKWIRRGEHFNKGACKALPPKDDLFCIYPTNETKAGTVIIETRTDFGCVLFEAKK